MDEQLDDFTAEERDKIVARLATATWMLHIQAGAAPASPVRRAVVLL